MNSPNRRESWPARDRLILRDHQLTTTEFVNYFASVDTRWSVLDVGCADGFFLEILRNLGFDQVYGMDEDPQCLEAAQAKGLRAFEGNIYDLEAKGQLDVVLMYNVLEHLDNAGLAITKIYDALKGDGILYLIVPVTERLPSPFWSKIVKIWARHEPVSQMGGFTTDSVCWLLRSHQLEIDSYVRTAGEAEAETGFSRQWLSLVARKARKPRRIEHTPPPVPAERPSEPTAEVMPELAEDIADDTPDDSPTVIEPRKPAPEDPLS